MHRHNRSVRGSVKVERNWVDGEVMRYESVESSYVYYDRGSKRNGRRLHLYLERPDQGNMNFCVYDSRHGLFPLLRSSKDHLDSIMVDWDQAIICADENSLEDQLTPAKRYPEVYVLICVDLLTRFAQTPVGQKYKTSQQRADLLCPFPESEELMHDDDRSQRSQRIIRFTDSLYQSVMHLAVSSIIAAPRSTAVNGPLREKVQARIRITAPAVTTLEHYSDDLNEVGLTQVMTNWMTFETLDESQHYDELCEHVSSLVKVKFEHDLIEGGRTEESIRRYETWQRLANAFTALQAKFGMTDASIRRNYPWMFNENLRANEYDTGIPSLPPGVNIPSDALTTDPCAEPVFVESDARGECTLKRSVYAPTVEYAKAKYWHVPGNTALDMSGKETFFEEEEEEEEGEGEGEDKKKKKKKKKRTKAEEATLINNGSWLKEEETEGWIRANFHVRKTDSQEDDFLYISQPVSMPTSSSVIEHRNVMGPPTGQYPVWEKKEAKPQTPGVFFIAHNRFGYLSHLNTLALQLTKVGLLNKQRKSLANRCAFEEMIERLRSSEHPQFFRRLSEIEQWEDQNFESPPPEPLLLSPLASLPSYSYAKITNAFVVLNQMQPEPDPEPGATVNLEPEPVPLDRYSSIKDIKKTWVSLRQLYNTDKCDAYLPLSQKVNDAYEICRDVVNAIHGGEIWRDSARRDAPPPALALPDAAASPALALPDVAASPALALLDGAASPALAVGAGGGSRVLVKRKRDPIEKKQTLQSNVKHYCSNPLHMCAHNRLNELKYKAGNGGFKPRYEVTEAGVDPYKNADTAPRLVCKECSKAGYPDMLLTRN